MRREPHWDEEKVKQRLRELPAIKDEQTKEKLFAAIQSRVEEIEGEQINRKKNFSRKRPWFFPTLASACALFIVLIIIPPFFSKDELSLDEHRLVNHEMDMEMDTGILSADNEMADGDMDFSDNGQELDSGELGVTEISDKWGMDESIIAIPYVEHVQIGDIITVKVMVEGMEKDLFENLSNELDELLLFILSRNEINGAMKIDDLDKVLVNGDEKEVTLDFTENNRLESLSSSEMVIYREMIREILSIYGFEKVHFTSNGEPGVMIGQTGYNEYTWDLPYENRGYYLYRNEDGGEYIVRGVAVDAWSKEKEGELSLLETLEQMKNVAEGAWYLSLIPDNVYFDDATINGNEAVIVLNEQSQLEKKDYDKFLQAVTLAASDFSVDYVTLIGDPINGIYPLGKTEKIPVRSIPNLRNN